MKTHLTTNVRQRFQVATATALLVAAMGSSALATEQTASGLLDKNSNEQARLATDKCMAQETINAEATADFNLGLRLFYSRDCNSPQVAATGSNSTRELTANNATLRQEFQPPGCYQLVAVNNSTRPRAPKITMLLQCDEDGGEN